MTLARHVCDLRIAQQSGAHSPGLPEVTTDRHRASDLPHGDWCGRTDALIA
jgi:hypothetical protein